MLRICSVIDSIPTTAASASFKNSISSVSENRRPLSLKKEFFVEKGYKVYEQKNAIYNDSELGKYFINQEKFDELKDFEVKPGDFIVSCSGTMGKISLVPFNAKKGIINQALLKISTEPKSIVQDYFLFVFRSNIIQNIFTTLSHGSAMQNVVSLKELKRIGIPVPPLPEQKQIASILSNVDTQIQKEKLHKSNLERLKKGLMQKLLTGQIRVKV